MPYGETIHRDDDVEFKSLTMKICSEEMSEGKIIGNS